MKDTINFLKARSTWATAAAVLTATEQAGAGDEASYTGILTAVATLLQATGVIDSGADFVGAFGPLVTAGFGVWAWWERRKATAALTLGKGTLQ